jgi:hypothetical protein
MSSPDLIINLFTSVTTSKPFCENVTRAQFLIEDVRTASDSNFVMGNRFKSAHGIGVAGPVQVTFLGHNSIHSSDELREVISISQGE